jgi:hypothetical protein
MTSTMRIRLRGKEVSFPPGKEIILGRGPTADVHTDNPLVSRNHARLGSDGKSWVLEDIGSKRGTFVDGQRVQRMPIRGPVTIWLAEPNAGQVLLLLPEGNATGIFISYRREDTAGDAGRLYDRLTAHFGEHMVFRDIDNIEPGTDFVGRIEDAIGACQVLLAVIGRNWLDPREPDGRRRLDNPADWVRLELTAALRQGIRVIPVLVQDVVMPRPEQLPEPLQELARRNALKLSDDRWNYDFGRLVEVVERTVGRPSPPSGQPPPGQPPRSPPANNARRQDNPVTPPPGNPAPPSAPPRPVSWVWWLLPVFLPIAGALFAWSATRDRDPAKARKLLLGGLIIGTVILVLSYIG